MTNAVRGPAWTRQDLSRLDGMIAAGMTDNAIAKLLGRTATAVQVKRKRARIASRRRQLMSSHQVARLMGIDGHAVAKWIKRGHLKARRGQRAGAHRQWYVTQVALMEFLDDSAHWHRWSPDRITDEVTRQWTARARAGRDRYVTTGEAGRRLGVTYGTVLQYIQRGLLPALRWGNWMIREEDLRGFVPPCEQARRAQTVRRFTREEDQQLRALYAAGVVWERIAASMQRSTSSVQGRAVRLGIHHRGARGGWKPRREQERKAA